MPEDACLDRARKGNVEAFNQLVETYQTLVYNVCLRMLGHVQQAEDATQETFFAAFRAISSYRGDSFRAWLLRIASNQCYDQLRRRQRRGFEPLADDPPLADPDPQPEQRALDAELIGVLEGAIRRLPPDQRLCVLLVDVQGLDYAEAAQAMHVNLGTVKSRLSRARARLRELLPSDLRLKSGG